MELKNYLTVVFERRILQNIQLRKVFDDFHVLDFYKFFGTEKLYSLKVRLTNKTYKYKNRNIAIIKWLNILYNNNISKKINTMFKIKEYTNCLMKVMIIINPYGNL